MQLNRVLNWALLLGLFVVPFICLFVSNSMFFPFITGKNFLFRMIIELVLAIWLVLLARGDTTGPKRSWVLISVSALILIATLAAIFGVNPYHSFWSNYERMDGLVNLFHLFAYFLVITSYFKTEKLWNLYLHTSMFTAIIISIIGIRQILGHAVINQGGVRVDATFGNATYLAVYMLFHICIALYYLLKRDSGDFAGLKRCGYGLLAILYASILYHTATRGSILGLIGALILTAVLSLFSLTGKERKIVIIPLAVILIFIAGFFMLRKTDFISKDPVLSRFTNMTFSDATTKSRMIIWGISLKGAKEHPLLGWGPENFNVVFNKYYDPRLYSQETWFDRAHNIIFEWLVATGILGLLSYLAIFGASVWTLWSRHSDIISPLQRNILVGLLAGYLFQNIFVFDNLFGYIMFFIIIGFIHYHSKEVVFPKWLEKIWSLISSTKKVVTGQMSYITSAVICVLLVGGMYWINVKPIMANKLLLQNLYPRTPSQEKLDNLRKMIALNTFGSVEAREQILLMLSDARNAPGTDQDLFSKFLDFGAQEMKKQIDKNGTDARQQLFMGSFLHTFGRADVAIHYYENAVNLSPNKQVALISLARAYIDSGRGAEALALNKKAYESETNFDRALVEYIANAILAKENKLAEELLKTDRGANLISDPRIIDAYSRSGQIDKVIEIYKVEIAKSPNNPNNQQNYFSLAASYYVARKDSLALKTLRDVIVAIPASKEQAEYYIDQISKGLLPR
ncbi:MAG TPA: O-antigen ligase family protein [Candidatus Paceibacterota bacterium]